MTFKENILCTLLGLIICLGLVVVPSLGQTPINNQLKQPTVEQQKSIKEAADLYRQLQQQADSAKDKLTIQLLSTLNSLGLKIEDVQLSWDKDGSLIILKAEPSIATDQNQNKKSKENEKNQKNNP